MPKILARKNDVGVTLGGLIGAAFLGSAITKFATEVAEGKYTIDVKFVEAKRHGKNRR